MPDQLNEFARYLPDERDPLDWGMRVTNCGYASVPARAKYPTGHHPDSFLFTWEDGRMLSQHQVLYISQGRGEFEAEGAGCCELEAGDAFLLFPGVWHRYRPLPETGWTEYWVGFAGDYAARLTGSLFSPVRPVVHVGHMDSLLRLFVHMSEIMQTTPPGYRLLAAAEAMSILMHLHALAGVEHQNDPREIQCINQAKCLLVEQAGKPVHWESLARDLDMSYTRFRKVFKQLTGHSPLQYLIEIRINKARELLLESSLPIGQIASKVGFESVYHFSSTFHAKTGRSPSDYRQGLKNPPPGKRTRRPRRASGKRIRI